jgi:hypothetical protein
MIFFKKSEGSLLSAKVQNHPNSSEIGRSLRKIQYIPPKAATMKQELICVSQVVYYVCGVFFLAFDFVFGSCFTKNRFWPSENGKGTFHWTKQKSVSVAFLAIPRVVCVSDMA